MKQILAIALLVNWDSCIYSQLDLKQEDLQVLVGHTHCITALCFSPDGKMIASGSVDKTIRLWDVETGRCKAILEGHIGNVFTLAFSRDGKTLYSGSLDMTLKSWETSSGKMTASIFVDNSPVYRISCPTNDNDVVAVGCENGTVVLLTDGLRCKRFLNGHTDAVYGLCFNNDSKLLASSCLNGTVILWDIGSGKPKLKNKAFDCLGLYVGFSNDNELISVGGINPSVLRWDSKTGEPKGPQLGPWDPRFMGRCVDMKNGVIAVAYKDTVWIDFFDIRTGKRVKEYAGNGVSYRLRFSPNGKILAEGDRDGNITLRKLEGK